MSDKRTEEIYIKNMVCPRCITVVRNTLEDLGFTVCEVELGKAKVNEVPDIPMEEVDNQLQKHGFELIREKNQREVEQIKGLLVRYVQELEEVEEPTKISDYLSNNLNRNYSSLSSAFSENEGITIEKYLIHLKIERVKELLSYEELTLSEIAFKLSYSSVGYLSNQFKQVTGMSVTDYKKAKDSFRRSLDGI